MTAPPPPPQPSSQHPCLDTIRRSPCLALTPILGERCIMGRQRVRRFGTEGGPLMNSKLLRGGSVSNRGASPPLIDHRQKGIPRKRVPHHLSHLGEFLSQRHVWAEKRKKENRSSVTRLESVIGEAIAEKALAAISPACSIPPSKD